MRDFFQNVNSISISVIFIDKSVIFTKKWFIILQKWLNIQKFYAVTILKVMGSLNVTDSFSPWVKIIPISWSKTDWQILIIPTGKWNNWKINGYFIVFIDSLNQIIDQTSSNRKVCCYKLIGWQHYFYSYNDNNMWLFAITLQIFSQPMSDQQHILYFKA